MQNAWQIKFGDLAKLANFSLTKLLSYMVYYWHAKGFSTRKIFNKISYKRLEFPHSTTFYINGMYVATCLTLHRSLSDVTLHLLNTVMKVSEPL